ncbi:hypothetical protein WMY93_012570 [Mugilogobius chulae]|uniref:Uncharacterized protein n=1 Tax=Mugilogobius chulae TaxID=88201 RepID=A0AAW0P3M7_9GOBI
MQATSLSLHAGHVSSASTQLLSRPPRPRLIGPTQATPHRPTQATSHRPHAGHVSSASRRPRLMSPNAGHVSSAFMQATQRVIASTQATVIGLHAGTCHRPHAGYVHRPPRRPRLIASMQATSYRPSRRPRLMSPTQATSHRPPHRPRFFGRPRSRPTQNASSAPTQATHSRPSRGPRFTGPSQATPWSTTLVSLTLSSSLQSFQPQHCSSSLLSASSVHAGHSSLITVPAQPP